MTVRQRAIKWIRNHHPAQVTNPLRSSRFYSEQEIWWFTFPSTYFDARMKGYLNIMCEKRPNSNDFNYLRVPFSFFRKNCNMFDIRANGDEFDLRISSKKNNWLVDERGNHITFAEFEQLEDN